jgi:transposase, IS6 family
MYFSPPVFWSAGQHWRGRHDVEHRQVKYLNNRLEADYGALKRLINPTRGFKTLPTASATIKGFEVMRI